MVNIWKIGLKPVAPELRTPQLLEDTWEMCRRREITVIGWPRVGELKESNGNSNRAQIFAKVQSAYKDKIAKTCGRIARQLNDFTNNISKGDVILAYAGEGTTKGIGIVESDYTYDPSIEHAPHTRRVKWISVKNYYEKMEWHDTIHRLEVEDITEDPTLKKDILTAIGEQEK